MTSSPAPKTVSYHKPGGTGKALTVTWSAFTCDCVKDYNGIYRWSFVTVQGKSGKKLTIITAYIVCRQSEKYAGLQTAIM